MGLLNNKNDGLMRRRVDFTNQNTRKALNNLVQHLSANFQLAAGETSFQSIAEDAIMEAIESPFIIMSIPLHQQIFDRALAICKGMASDEDETVEQISEPDLEDVYHLVDSTKFTGSIPQIKWASDIAHKSAADIAEAIKENPDVNLPTTSSWWIDNQNDIKSALLKVKHVR